MRQALLLLLRFNSKLELSSSFISDAAGRLPDGLSTPLLSPKDLMWPFIWDGDLNALADFLAPLLSEAEDYVCVELGQRVGSALPWEFGYDDEVAELADWLQANRDATKYECDGSKFAAVYLDRDTESGAAVLQRLRRVMNSETCRPTWHAGYVHGFCFSDHRPPEVVAEHFGRRLRNERGVKRVMVAEIGDVWLAKNGSLSPFRSWVDDLVAGRFPRSAFMDTAYGLVQTGAAPRLPVVERKTKRKWSVRDN